MLIYPNFLSREEVKQVIEILDSKPLRGTHIYIDAQMVGMLLPLVAPKLPGFTFTNHISSGVTVEAIRKHTDPKLDRRVTHKLLVYLQIPRSGGGTYFKNFGYVKPEIGKAVVFGIDEPHWSEPFPKGDLKRVFGLRMYKEA